MRMPQGACHPDTGQPSIPWDGFACASLNGNEVSVVQTRMLMCCLYALVPLPYKVGRAERVERADVLFHR